MQGAAWRLTVPWRALIRGLVLCLVLAGWLAPGYALPVAAAGATRYVAPTGSDSGDCSGSTAPCQTIGYAISQAQAGDTISIAAGTYPETVTIPLSLTLVGAGASRTIVDGHQSGTVVTVNAGATVAITGMTIQDGSGLGIGNYGTLTVTNGTVSGNSLGGIGDADRSSLTLASSTVSGNSGSGIGNYSGQVTLINSTVSGNSTRSNDGGGIHNMGILTLTNSTVSGNSTSNGYSGGGIYNCGIYYNGILTLTNSTVSGNSTSNGGSGGGIDNCGTGTITGTVTLTNSTVSGNSASVGGGISNLGPMTLTNSTVSGNSVSIRGGGIDNFGPMTLTNSTVVSNTISNTSTGYGGWGGGGINNGAGATVTLTNSTVSGNGVSYGNGGGILNYGIDNYGHAATITLTNSTVSGNSVFNGNGGGIYSFGIDIYGHVATVRQVTLTNSTVAGNSVSGGSGGGIDSDSGTVLLSNSILAGNTAPANLDCYASLTSGGYNLLGIGDGGCSGLTNGVNGDQVGTGSSPLLPLLDPLGDYGGPTWTMLPQRGSPALDAVPASHCPLTTDQRGQPRPDEAADSGACDSGAVEGVGPAPTISLSASSLDFGTESVDYFGVTRTVTLTNSSVVPLFLSSTGITITGTDSEDFLESDTCAGTTIAPGASCTIDVNFWPGAAGTRSAVLSITDNAADSPQRVALSGIGQFAVAGVSPLALDFGAQLVGTASAAQSVTVQNTSQADLGIFGIVGANFGMGGAFTASTSDCFVDAIAPGDSCTFDVLFEPQATGRATGALFIFDNAADSPQMVTLSGTGTLPAANTPVPPGATPTNVPVPPPSPPASQPTATPTRTRAPSAAPMQPTATTLVVCHGALVSPAPPPLSVGLAPHGVLAAGVSLPGALHGRLPFVTGGGPLPLLIRTAPHATVTASLDVVATQVVIRGTGAHRTRSMRRVVLYHTALRGTADATGRYSPRMHVAYQPNSPVVATLSVWAQASCGTAIKRTRLTILPLRITVTPRRLVGGSPLTITLHTGGKGQVSITVEVDTTRDTVMGQGTQRHHVRQVVALYRLRVTGTADAHGRFSRRVAIAYRPRTPLLASIAVTVRMPQGTATGRATATLLPRRHR